MSEVEDLPTVTEDVLLGEQEVKVSQGRRYVIAPWGIRTGRRLMGRLNTVLRMVAVAAGEGNLQRLLEECYDEIVGIVADTIDVPQSEFETDFELSDLLSLVNAILDVNFLARPGGNELGKAIEGLVARMDKMMPAEEPPVSETATLSEPPSSS